MPSNKKRNLAENEDFVLLSKGFLQIKGEFSILKKKKRISLKNPFDEMGKFLYKKKGILIRIRKQKEN